MCAHVYTYVYACIYICAYIHSCLLRGPGSDTLTPWSAPSTQILDSKYHSPLKRTKASWRNGCPCMPYFIKYKLPSIVRHTVILYTTKKEKPLSIKVTSH